MKKINQTQKIKLKTDRLGNPIPLLVPKAPANQGEPRKQYVSYMGVIMTREDYCAMDRS